MQPVTYDLRNGRPDSGDYYRHINVFATEVYDRIEQQFGPAITGLVNHTRHSAAVRQRTRAEYAVEVLTLGITWKRYAGAAGQTPRAITNLLSFLYRIRRNNRWLKPAADRLRGRITGRCVLPRIGTTPDGIPFSLRNFRCLIRWLEATGEFKDEVKRLAIWYEYLGTLQPGFAEQWLREALSLFDWFETNARRELGRYTAGVDEFLKLKYPAYKNREDAIFCGKQEVEYHLNMVGAEIMNRGFAPAYDHTGCKTLLVPGCMRHDDGATCRALVDGFNITCTQCHNGCRVGHLTRLGQQHGFDVFIVPHSSGFTQWLKRWENSTSTGLIAVACLLNLVPGGYEMRELNIPAQCLLLDFCGCRKHWHPTGIATDINEQRLLQLVKEPQATTTSPQA